MRYIDIVRSIVSNARANDVPALTWDEQKHHINAIRQKIDDIEIVVRCKDCRYCADYTDGHRECRLLKNLKTVPCTYVLVDGNDYCSHGERREP